MKLLHALAARLRRYAEKDGRGYPDWATRYVPIARWPGASWRDARVLEIGANANGIARFTPVRSIAVDIATDHLREARDAQETRPVAADLRTLPFPNEVFDHIVCVDVFEHIEAGARMQAIVEMHRCLAPGGRLVLAFPEGEAAQQAEARVREAYRQFTGQKLRWLEEHTQVGLPNADTVHQALAHVFQSTHTITRRGNLNVHAWTWMWRILMAGWPGRGNSVFQVLLRWSTPLLTRLHWPPCYRVIFFIEPRGETCTR